MRYSRGATAIEAGTETLTVMLGTDTLLCADLGTALEMSLTKFYNERAVIASGVAVDFPTFVEHMVVFYVKGNGDMENEAIRVLLRRIDEIWEWFMRGKEPWWNDADDALDTS